MKRHLPRLLLAGTSSGSGKTTAVCAVLSLLLRRTPAVRSCKCGPDYIDPMFHRSVLGVDCSNLDPFFTDGNRLRYLLAEQAKQARITVIEGVMGYYDGTGPDGMQNSTYTVARETQSPVVLVVNAKGAYTSVLATIEGFLRFVPDSGIRGVILNHVTPMTYQALKKMIEQHFGERITVAGYLPRLPEDCQFASRHLGLVTADELGDIRQTLAKIADLTEKTLDIDALLRIADAADELSYEAPDIPVFDRKIRLAVARDQAFCFCYKDNLSLLEAMGAEILPFSPLQNEPVPEGADGLLLCGGYPELHTAELAAHTNTKDSIRKAIADGMPTVAECGGFQYLGDTLDGAPMCGVLPHASRNTGKLVRFGYSTLTARTETLFGPAGTTLRAHEFHYYDSTENGEAWTAEKANGKTYTCAVSTPVLYAGYPHLYLYANIPAAASLYRACLEYHERKALL